jgi:hypothetical protein
MPDTAEIANRLTALEIAITAGLAEINNRLSNALLEQERRNSSFVTRDRLDDLGRKLDALAIDISNRANHFLAIEQAQKDHSFQLAQLSDRLSTATIDRLKIVIGVLASTLTLIVAGIITYLLTVHVH